jgi:uncharacterized protein YlxP (DUF503 family)
MAVARLTIELRIPMARSLKDRRQVVRSLKDQLRHGFNVSVAELDEDVTWQSAVIGVAAISRSRDYLEGQMREVESAVVRIVSGLGAEVSESWWEYLD